MEQRTNPLTQCVRSTRGAFLAVGLFSLAINLLMLTGPLFMLQVYDRVLTSRSVPTLAALFGLVVVLYVFFGLFDYFRTRVLSRIGYYIDSMLSRPALNVFLASRLLQHSNFSRPIADLNVVRNFLNGQGLPALFDLPWTPIYLAIVFLLHPSLGWLAIGGVFVIVCIAAVNEFSTRRALRDSVGLESRENQFAEFCVKNAEAVFALGMLGHVSGYWGSMRNAAKATAQTGGDRGQVFSSGAKASRLLVQSAILAMGGLLFIYGEISAGTIVAASILAGRALSPIDQTIGNWKSIAQARQAYGRLKGDLAGYVGPVSGTQLPAPEGRVEVSRIIKLAPVTIADPEHASLQILKDLNFTLTPSDALGVIGPSAAGKSTLARLLVGLQAPDQGSVRLDGATLDQWDPDVIGQHIGYLPQTVELLPGTLKQNIARFDPAANDDEVIEAAKVAGAHDLIVRMSEGYDTRIDFGLPPLSGGQAQRIALARALFRMPKLIVLDEPTSNLDAEGDAALSQAILRMRKAGSTVVVMTHRPQTLAACNLVLVIRDGKQVEFGEKTATLRKLAQQNRTAKPSATGETVMAGAPPPRAGHEPHPAMPASSQSTVQPGE